ncbi:putative toxin-antitoxin system toxin component, PIN family [Cognataquiflexum rubidum]|uniref:putative toxin-antitoxin system toxin component, PIN family n=1 Tax=Cognataquiflexum rubidum TaxID=2922273 RepID=UPI001F14254F|nr:putative toxin-antitoxin system toxin component, PIN family [Cognataquiflexum rubidum]MCH6232878.1 putative toxin-antitoxin system toxin component, PIN family [Cognataquiflexum rubidum]
MKNSFIFDTNSLISSVLSPLSTNASALKSALKIGDVMLSQETWKEFKSVIFRNKFDRYFTVEQRNEILALLDKKFVFFETHSTFKACRDPKDDMFLHLAVDAKAKCIVTGDPDLLVLHPFEGIPILTPTEFLEKFV